MRAMIDTTDGHLRMLQRFDINTDQWSAIVCVLLLDKLDPETRAQWETKEKLPQIPDLKELFTHMEQRILAIRNMEQTARHYGQASGKIHPGKSGKATTTEANRYQPYDRERKGITNGSQLAKPKERPTAPDCPKCGNHVKHFLWHCDGFKALSSAEQLAQLSKWNICEVCLIAKHKAADCTKGICPICKTARHNSLVCPQRVAKQVNHARGGKHRSHGTKPQ